MLSMDGLRLASHNIRGWGALTLISPVVGVWPRYSMAEQCVCEFKQESRLKKEEGEKWREGSGSTQNEGKERRSRLSHSIISMAHIPKYSTYLSYNVQREIFKYLFTLCMPQISVNERGEWDGALTQPGWQFQQSNPCWA